MAITPLNPVTLNPRIELLAEIMGLIDDAATSEEPANPVSLAELIMRAVDQSGYVPEV